jgi:catechol 2,3-dioxygenase-like lactoylglutathione lyase family enzyme
VGELSWPIWIGVVCEDLAAQRRFYTDVLGLTEVDVGEEDVTYDLDGGHLELLARTDRPEYDERRVQFAFTVPDIAAAYRELIDAGVEPVSEIRGVGRYSQPWAYFRDREGNVFAIKQR